MQICTNTFELDDICGSVEGQPKAVDNYLAHLGNALIGKPRTSQQCDDMVLNNSSEHVKVTTYKPVECETPLGLPSTDE